MCATRKCSDTASSKRPLKSLSSLSVTSAPLSTQPPESWTGTLRVYITRTLSVVKIARKSSLVKTTYWDMRRTFTSLLLTSTHVICVEISTSEKTIYSGIWQQYTVVMATNFHVHSVTRPFALNSIWRNTWRVFMMMAGFLSIHAWNVTRISALENIWKTTHILNMAMIWLVRCATRNLPRRNR